MSKKIIYVPRKVNFEPKDYLLVRLFASQKGLGDKGFSAANRMIIREWATLTKFMDELKNNSNNKQA